MFADKLIGVNYSGGSKGSNIGCELAGRAISEIYPDLFTSEDAKQISFSFKQEISVNNTVLCGEAHKHIYEELRDENMEGTLFIGGDHSISLPITRQLYKNGFLGDEKSALLIFDAHLDMCADSNNPTHEDWLRSVINEGVVQDENIFMFGVRDVEKREWDFIKTTHVHLYEMQDIFTKSFEKVFDSLVSQIRQFEYVHCSFDIDVVDASAVPGTGYPSPGGLSSREMIASVQELVRLPNTRSYDLVEINPSKDFNKITLQLGRKIITELI